MLSANGSSVESTLVGVPKSDLVAMNAWLKVVAGRSSTRNGLTLEVLPFREAMDVFNRNKSHRQRCYAKLTGYFLYVDNRP